MLPYTHMHRPASLRHYRWLVAPAIPDDSPLRAADEGVHPILRQILYNRGLTQPGQIQTFLANHYLSSRDPFLLADMERAVERIGRALRDGEMIVVYGDFDADGVTATVLLTQALRRMADDRRLIQPYIPDRVDEGYGLNLEALTALRAKGASVVISVDCGIRSPVEAAHAQAIGLDLIITDHHSLGRELPPAAAVINPKRPDSTYPEKMLAGVGIAYKLAQALRLAYPDRAMGEESDLLDLVAIGTVADLAPLVGENRKLVAEGLAVLNEVRRPGIAALMNVSGLQAGQMTAESIGFALGPRINAAGRLAHAYDAARLLIAAAPDHAQEQARLLDELNRQRQSLTRRLSALAEQLIDPDAPIIIAGNPEFKSGVVGLVASRLAEKTYRPAIVMELGEAESRGSCRSIPEFHITHALDEVADLLVRHGGHAQAAGFTIRNENLPAFIERMTAIAGEQLSGADLRPGLEIDAALPLRDVDWALHGTLEQLEPTGNQNPQPLLLSRGVEVVSHRPVGTDGSHLQLYLVDGHNGAARYGGARGRPAQAFPAIAFRQGEWAGALPKYVDVVYRVGLNRWNGNTNLQLVVEDICPAEDGSTP
ncbi:Single-stranded-DNA-specific exonuclease [Candidatus Promineifilum breve]|uniref:Single-stranded-DNA-specific exonuclease RecJ n=1 Tax=Candidatus Promineifilum breve TaxID=1806508 RepID=A0A160T0C9_9CHLR|nr:single-stranded-DNA-specific exonuclease RecJ [Candidatus Promineifilum breve]CUS02852.2 Single-stranded-DNA-specific exonuclease [Candidatus Promineifilum breve]